MRASRTRRHSCARVRSTTGESLTSPNGISCPARRTKRDANGMLEECADIAPCRMSWSFIGCAVRLAQELGIHNIYFGSEKERGPITWEEERCLRTWICESSPTLIYS